jgi:hypothetical protein
MRISNSVLLILFTVVIAPVSLHSQMNQNSLQQTCKAQVSTRIKHWRMAPVRSDVGIKPAVKLYIIGQLYCGDGISLAKKGRKYHDFEQETEGTFSEDGVSAYCFEKAGATYEFANGSFRRIVDSD